MSDLKSVLTFNGSSDYISVTDGSSWDITNYTVEVWIKPNGEPNETWAGIVDSNFNILLRKNGTIHHRFNINNNNDARIPRTPENSIEWDKWSHVAITNNGENAKTYINGELKAEGATGGNIVLDETPLYVARNLDGKSNSYFKGQIADIRVWNQSRSQEDIKNDMSRRLKGDEQGLVGYWLLNEGSGNIAGDRTANENEGTIHGGTWEQTEIPIVEQQQHPIVEQQQHFFPEQEEGGTGLVGYAYWYCWKQNLLQEQSEKKEFRRGRISV
ncbi:MAG: hypothetical protein F6J93_34910 [Oscillatoria sp. SIO1A7]|nr:hypothetical protein [Oscillatoria sp. SIO1A7]